jgi:hypothetical protein
MLDALAHWPGAVWLQNSGTAYLVVNAVHILGIGLILGAILPLDLRLMGLFRQTPLPVIAPFLSRAAAAGVVVALLTGFWLFSVQPDHYLGNTAFLAKLGVLALALGNIGLQHGHGGYRQVLEGGAVPWSVRLVAATSIGLWLGVLLAGRWIGFL